MNLAQNLQEDIPDINWFLCCSIDLMHIFDMFELLCSGIREEDNPHMYDLLPRMDELKDNSIKSLLC